MSEPSPSTPKRKVHRSPNYPAISIEAALQRVRLLHKAEGKHDAAVEVALRHLGYTNVTSSAANGVLSALVKYGLVVSSGSGATRRIQVSEPARRIILDELPESPERDRLIREAVLMPAIHSEMWTKWGPDLPSDQNMRNFLLLEKEFNQAVADDVIKNYRASLAFSCLDKRSPDPKNSDTNQQVTVGSYVQWTSNSVDQFEVPRRVREISENGEWALVEDSNTGVLVSELSVVEKPHETPHQEQSSRDPFAGRQAPPPTPKKHEGPFISFPLSNENTFELRLSDRVSKKDFERLKKLIELSEDSLVDLGE